MVATYTYSISTKHATVADAGLWPEELSCGALAGCKRKEHGVVCVAYKVIVSNDTDAFGVSAPLLCHSVETPALLVLLPL